MYQMLYWILFFPLERILKVWTSKLYCSWSWYICNPVYSLFCPLIAEQYDVKVSVNDIIIKVVAASLRNVPEANGKWFPLIVLSILVNLFAYNCLREHGFPFPIIAHMFQSACSIFPFLECTKQWHLVITNWSHQQPKHNTSLSLGVKDGLATYYTQIQPLLCWTVRRSE